MTIATFCIAAAAFAVSMLSRLYRSGEGSGVQDERLDTLEKEVDWVRRHQREHDLWHLYRGDH